MYMLQLVCLGDRCSVVVAYTPVFELMLMYIHIIFQYMYSLNESTYVIIESCTILHV